MEEATPKLLAAARTVFARYGYHGATAERIAKSAGISRVTLHRKGLTKNVLLQSLVTEATESYRSSMWPAMTADGNGRQRMNAALEALCESAERDLGLLIALRAQSDSVFHEDGTEVLTRTVFTEPLERLLRDGIADGSLRKVDPIETATVLFNMVGWTYVHLRSDHGWAPGRAREAVIGVALCGVTAPDDEPAPDALGRSHANE
jgi:AcrR family transcriptional regulator